MSLQKIFLVFSLGFAGSSALADTDPEAHIIQTHKQMRGEIMVLPYTGTVVMTDPVSKSGMTSIRAVTSCDAAAFAHSMMANTMIERIKADPQGINDALQPFATLKAVAKDCNISRYPARPDLRSKADQAIFKADELLLKLNL